MSTNIVPTNIEYSSYLLRQNLNNLNRIFPFLNIQTVGRSVLGQNIYVIKLGNGPKKVFYSGGIHANVCIYQLHTFYLSKNNVLILLERYFLLY